MTNIPSVYFYIPKSDWPECEIPVNADTNWLLYESKPNNGVYAWTLQTYIRLKADGFPCELTDTIPTEGVVFAHRYSLPFNFKPKPRLLIVCLKADHDQHPYAQLHVVQNKQEISPDGCYYIPLWRQPGLIKRDRARGDKFENVAYFGIEKNLALELKAESWSKQLQDLGLRWQIVAPDGWNDYSNIDAIVAVRSFQHQESYTYKPATKLYNAWHADVPAILGSDSAFRAERQSELDYLEVASVNDAIIALKHLRDRKELRDAMVENGRVRAAATQPETLINQWRTFITDVAVPAYHRWCQTSNLNQKIYLARHYLTIKENNLKPHPLYPHDHQQVGNEQMDIQQELIISTMQLYRQVKKLLVPL